MSRRGKTPRGIGLLVVGALAMTACGSTVQSRGEVFVGGDVPTGPGTGGAFTGGTPGTGADLTPGTSGTTTGGTTGGGVTSPGGAQQPAPSGGSTTGGISISSRTGPGVTPTTIAIGIPYCNDCAAGNAAIGAAGEDPGDTRRYYQVALDDVNARGGVLGRKLVPVWHEGSVNETSLDASAQAACETFTKDNKVLIMTFRGNIAYECAKRAGIMVVGPGNTRPTFTRYPNLFAPSLIRLERLYEVTVRSMVRAGWHKPSGTWRTGRIGLITWDDTDYRYGMTHGYLKGLRATGLKATDVRYIAVPQNANSLASASAAVSSAVLAFRRAGIDHVFIGDGPAGVFTGTGLTFLFLQNAESQRYYPRYGFNSYNSPDFANHPKDQLAGMLAIDSSDSEPLNDQGITPNPVRERCFALMRKRGLPVGQGQTQTLAANACGYIWFAEAVLRRATAGTTLPDMIKAAESLGTSFRSPSSYGNRIGPDRHDGAALFRQLRYDAGCECIRYTSKPFEP